MPQLQASAPRFDLGRVVATRGAILALEESDQTPVPFIHRHLVGDWGDLDAEDHLANERALEDGSRLLSAYRTSGGAKLWIITEADRSATTLLLPEEY